MKSHPLASLGDAIIILVLLLALAFGAPVEWIVGIYLALEVVSHLARAFGAFLEPLTSLVRR